MSFDWWTLGLQTVNLLVLLWVLTHFLFRPVSEILAKRQAAAREALESARSAEAKAEAALATQRAAEGALAERREQFLAAAQKDADETRQQMIEDTRKDIARLRSDAEAEMRRARAAADRAMQDTATDLAIDIAQRLLERLPPEAHAAAFTDGLVAAVAELPAQTRAAMGRGGPVPLRVARQLSDDAVAQLETRLSEVLGHDITLIATADPALIAGLELDAPHATVRNHLRADLERIRHEVLRDD